jgi:hypothetical protein
MFCLPIFILLIDSAKVAQVVLGRNGFVVNGMLIIALISC